MSPDSPPLSPRPPHPLAVALIARLRRERRERVLEIGTGSGRNRAAIEAAGFTVVPFDADRTPAQGAIATHSLLHGTPSSIAETLREIASRLDARAPLYATFGSIRDRRFGRGEEHEPFVFAPTDGDEAGVAHTFFDGFRLRELLEHLWTIESMREVAVDEIAGTWAHAMQPLRGAVHWFVIATKRQ